MNQNQKDIRAEFDQGKITLLQYIAKLFNLFVQGVIKTSIWNLLKVFVVIVFSLLVAGVAWTSYKIISSQEATTIFIKRIQAEREDDIRGLALRDAVTPRITEELDKMIYSSGADRAIIFEFHNGKSNPTGLPFKFMDGTYERVNDDKDIRYLSDQMVNLPITHYIFPYYVCESKIFIGKVDSVRTIDNRFGQWMDEHAEKYISAARLIAEGEYIGWMAVFYNEIDSADIGEIRSHTERTALVVQNLLSFTAE